MCLIIFYFHRFLQQQYVQAPYHVLLDFNEFGSYFVAHLSFEKVFNPMVCILTIPD